ncbi:Formate hydrogenlyase subunit 6/NADH:ubiquinone oxidoreductase 23 kD subunit (chain I), partial [Dysosmobacter welbionis]
KFDGAVQDTLAELRRKWSGQIPALLEERFDTLGIQYMKLPHEMGVAALGQELSTFGWA